MVKFGLDALLKKANEDRDLADAIVEHEETQEAQEQEHVEDIYKEHFVRQMKEIEAYKTRIANWRGKT